MLIITYENILFFLIKEKFIIENKIRIIFNRKKDKKKYIIYSTTCKLLNIKCFLLNAANMLIDNPIF